MAPVLRSRLDPAVTAANRMAMIEALAKGDRLSLLRLQLVPRGDLLNWRLPTDGASGAPASGPLEIVWREPRRQALPPRFASGKCGCAHGGDRCPRRPGARSTSLAVSQPVSGG